MKHVRMFRRVIERNHRNISRIEAVTTCNAAIQRYRTPPVPGVGVPIKVTIDGKVYLGRMI
jgi:hypothetical protein